MSHAQVHHRLIAVPVSPLHAQLVDPTLPSTEPEAMTGCQVSENWKTGPVTAHATIMRHATAKVDARPHCREVH
jgi:hypothetical protein